ncbi:hypothetical protein [uncultured Maribacter sp.]|uniref:hypothetical protein n=1 Tax=uncultured Maribacter sp. TaxID=431308 RepID=UPI0026382988|nr:hypothetical protein [uncultured Maribacter sp.]
MDTVFLNIIYFVLPLLIVGVLVKYVFNVNVAILWPSAIMVLLFIGVTICSPFTLKEQEAVLFPIFCVLQLVALVAGMVLLQKQEIVWKHFFISLPFQLIYWVQLFYYGGLQFTHKF